MTPVITGPSGAHRAALTLHALADVDRAWVLDALDVDDRDRLRPLLCELEELAIPRDGGLADSLAQAGREEQVRKASALEDLTDARVHQLAQLLAGEPTRLVAGLVSGGPWPWRQHLLSCLPDDVTREAQRLAAAMPQARKLHAAVLGAVCGALQDTPVVAAPAAPAGRWATLRGRLAAWRRRR